MALSAAPSLRRARFCRLGSGCFSGAVALFFSVVFFVSSAPQSAHAATYYWDTNNSTAGFGTAGGTWAAPTTNNSTQGWSASSAGTNSLSGTTTTATADALHFGTASDGLAAGTITLSANVSAGSITFGSASGNITLGSANRTITLGSTPTITVNSSNATIVAKIAGSTGLTKNGTGILIVPMASTYSGTTTVNAGTLRIENLATNGGEILYPPRPPHSTSTTAPSSSCIPMQEGTTGPFRTATPSTLIAMAEAHWSGLEEIFSCKVETGMDL